MLTSVRSRATAGASLVLAVALVIGAVASAGVLRRALSSDAESLLIDRVDEVQALINNGLLTPLLAPTGHDVGQVQVIDAAGDVVAGTPGLATATRLDAITAPAVGDET